MGRFAKKWGPTMKSGQNLSIIVGVLLVAAFQVLSPWSLIGSGPGLGNMFRAAFWFGIVGVGGGLAGYEIIRRIKGINLP